MEKEFIPYEQALELKELGFDEPCLMYYDYSCTLVESGVYEYKAPLYQQAFRWFREKYNLLGYVSQATISKGKVFMFGCNEGNDTLFEDIDSDFKTYEEAELECLKKLIEIVKNDTIGSDGSSVVLFKLKSISSI